MKKRKATVIGVDLGGTKVKAGRVIGEELAETHILKVSSQDSQHKVIEEVIEVIEAVFINEVAGIGIGVPSIVDVEKGIVWDVVNIPSWRKVPIKGILEERFKVPVYVNNDANCFAVGEKYFGKGKGVSNMIGLIIGTGLAAGIIIEDRLYNGMNGGAGEFGMIPYRDKYFEYYASGQFFENVHGTNGPEVFRKAKAGDTAALKIFDEFGHHLGKMIVSIMYAIDPGLIVLGGSVSQAYPFFKERMWSEINQVVYRPVLENLRIQVSTEPDIALFGAAALFYNAHSS
jgi:glucokinase